MENKPNGFGIASLILGIIGILTRWYYGLGCILGIIAVVLSVKSKKQIGPNGMATAGLILGILAIIFGAFALACTVCVGGAIIGSLT